MGEPSAKKGKRVLLGDLETTWGKPLWTKEAEKETNFEELVEKSEKFLERETRCVPTRDSCSLYIYIYVDIWVPMFGLAQRETKGKPTNLEYPFETSTTL